MRPLGYQTIALPTFQLLRNIVERAMRASAALTCHASRHVITQNHAAGDRNTHRKPTVVVTLLESAFRVELHGFSLILRRKSTRNWACLLYNLHSRLYRTKKKREKVQTDRSLKLKIPSSPHKFCQIKGKTGKKKRRKNIVLTEGIQRLPVSISSASSSQLAKHKKKRKKK